MNVRVNVLIAVRLPKWWEDLAVDRYRKHASPGTELFGGSLTELQASRSLTEGVEACVLENALAAEDAGANVHILDCFTDPGLEFLSSHVVSPVVGVGRSGLQYAHNIFRRFGVITSEVGTIDKIRENAEKYHLDSHLSAEESVGIAASEIPRRREETLRRLEEIGRSMAGCVDGIVLGCTELAEFAPLLQDMLKSTGIAIVNPIAVTIRFAEARSLVNR